jgi:hypothetical protein
MLDNQSGRRNLTDGWQYQLKRTKKEILLEQGRLKNLETGGRPSKEPLSTIDKGLPKYHGKECPECEHSCWQTDENCSECGFDFMADYRNNVIDKSVMDKLNPLLKLAVLGWQCLRDFSGFLSSQCLTIGARLSWFSFRCPLPLW